VRDWAPTRDPDSRCTAGRGFPGIRWRRHRWRWSTAPASAGASASVALDDGPRAPAVIHYARFEIAFLSDLFVYSTTAVT
jgi:hypothetical protein